MTLIAFREARDAQPTYRTEDRLTLSECAGVVRKGINMVAQVTGTVMPGTRVTIMEKESAGRVDFTIYYSPTSGLDWQQFFSVVDTDARQGAA